ncbi:helix-turn-helix transcriptional regulator [Paenibacillus radicis (ex Gao et al. 2016)]|uniref:DeoR family transcriptional regulator n=1 Tax=Paenibacillus radicis (ex Gao et al. 2016) TaxID=1737354 RepID=A0A917GSC5_9BACL|nr:metalloregulator ArsR/SmtB family transcription factor [Paenibacillus radicis (ex Gao et al. 2016)]GGG55157.1 DeoR family transcriptional regulator [Paenibacillus radicis (ex Gao et al. 2016)]
MKQVNGLSTRETILHLLKTNGELSAKDLTEQLGLTGMAVRRHLESFESSGWITQRSIKQAMGRPTALYSLTEHAEHYFPKKYNSLTLDLLGELGQESGDEMVNLLFDRRKESMLSKYAPAMENKALADKVAALAQIQNDNGYMVQWEQESEDEFVLKEHNCPIADVANAYGHACNCELQLFRSLLNADVSRTECLAKGDRRCEYRIKKTV